MMIPCKKVTISGSRSVDLDMISAPTLRYAMKNAVRGMKVGLPLASM